MLIRLFEDIHIYDPHMLFLFQILTVWGIGLFGFLAIVFDFCLYVLADTRDIDEDRRNTVIENIRQSAIRIAKGRGVRLFEFNVINQDPPALAEKAIIKAVEAASKELNLTHKFMISRAYHDSLFMARCERQHLKFKSCNHTWCAHCFPTKCHVLSWLWFFFCPL